MENAAKYAPAGTTITVMARPVDGEAEIAVVDEGCGIAPADRDRVFDLFHRAARGDGAPAGTGMGLAIVKGLVEAHGGTVRAGAGPGGRGASIVMRLPLAPPTPTEDA
jgi:two-component system sensor histidine kinase KdpD